ncbi:hypothetical protein [Methylobacterium frigidaeris]|uniref:Uncharacterized protein n=1 Tax=Methylobacterium frigidaeris TaxID=2038277 RepID=A0AA37HDX7_9HYPH|nr:hypothetical protein [Methylobacterium frigidaeris]GJD63741.1 hypothetical protein MPEAHAMD_3912 [Methylobacterium frigidaeris]
MQQSQAPAKFPVPFGNSAGPSYIRDVPQESQVGINDGAASLETGFPPKNFQPVGSGGVPPFGQDMNGILKRITQWSRWQAAGATNLWDSAFATAIGGYPRGAVLGSTTPGLLWVSVADNNLTNPDGINADGWRAVLTDAAVPSTALVRAGADTSGTANQIVIPAVAPALNGLQNYQVFEIIPNVSVTGSTTVRLASYEPIPLKRRDGGDLQNGDAPVGQPFLAVFLNGVLRSLGMRPSEIVALINSSIASNTTIYNTLSQVIGTSFFYSNLGAVPDVVRDIGASADTNTIIGEVNIPAGYINLFATVTVAVGQIAPTTAAGYQVNVWLSEAGGAWQRLEWSDATKPDGLITIQLSRSAFRGIDKTKAYRVRSTIWKNADSGAATPPQSSLQVQALKI